MATLLELAAMAPVIIALLSLVIHYRLARVSNSGLFAYGLLIVAAIAIATVAITMAPDDQAIQAGTDLAIMLAGVLAFAASGWLLFASGMAGDTDGR
jgi:hypothetical protein